MGRTGTGATLATLPLTGAAIAAASGKPSLMWALIAISAAVLLGTFANRFPVLHGLPLIGAPKPVVTFKVNGSGRLIARLPPRKPDEPPPFRTAQIQVGVWNPSSFERIDRALINFLLPVGLLRKKTDASGARREVGGEWLVTPRDRVAGRSGSFDYWSQDDVDYAAGSAGLMFFEATFEKEGEYPIRMRISAPTLYEKDYDTDAVLRVEVADDGPVEKITGVIARGVALRARLGVMTEGRRRASVFDFLLEARTVVESEYSDAVPLLSAATPHEGPQVGVEYHEALVRDDLAALHEIRRRLGEAEDTK